MGASPILVVTGPSGAGKTTVSRLVAAAFDPSVHVPMDAFIPFVVNGWVDQWRLEAAAHQHYVFGGACAAAAIQFATGGYTAVLDGHMFPVGLQGLGVMCRRQGVPLHYAVLRPDLETCVARLTARHGRAPELPEELARQHSRLCALGRYEANVFDPSGTPEEVASAVLAAFTAGELVEASSAA